MPLSIRIVRLWAEAGSPNPLSGARTSTASGIWAKAELGRARSIPPENAKQVGFQGCRR